ncbi:hypothetical protein GN956_G21487 [Arapaima gigas]
MEFKAVGTRLKFIKQRLCNLYPRGAGKFDTTLIPCGLAGPELGICQTHIIGTSGYVLPCSDTPASFLATPVLRW